jgi:hypothetical protein
MTAHAHRSDDDTLCVDERHIDGESHANGVDPPALLDDEASFETLAPEQPSPLGAAISGHFGRGHHDAIAHQPGHGTSLARRAEDDEAPTTIRLPSIVG